MPDDTPRDDLQRLLAGDMIPPKDDKDIVDRSTQVYGRLNPRMRTRPILGQDIEDLKRARCSSLDDIELDTNDVIWQLGLNMPYMSLTVSTRRKNGHPDLPGFFAPVPDRTRAVLTRFLMENPDAFSVPLAPTSFQLFEIIRSTPGFETFSKADFSLLLGNVPSGGFRWLKSSMTKTGSDGRSKIVRQAMMVIYHQLLPRMPNDRAIFLKRWIISLIREMRARGVTLEEFITPSNQAKGSSGGGTRRKRSPSSGRRIIIELWKELEKREPEINKDWELEQWEVAQKYVEPPDHVLAEWARRDAAGRLSDKPRKPSKKAITG